MRLNRLVAAAATACLVLVTGVADAAAVHSPAAAAAQADADLALVVLPAGALPHAGSPNSRLDNPAQSVAVGSLVDHNLWWTAPGTMAGFLAFLQAHPPQGFTHDMTGSGGTDQVTTWGYNRNGSQDETLLVSVIRDGDHVDVRADAQVIWTPDKTSAEIIPPTLTSATFDYKGPMAHSFGSDTTTPKPAHAHRVLTGTVLRRVAAAVNALQTEPAGAEYSCPADNGEAGKIRAFYGGQHVTFDLSFTGCAFLVEVMADGAVQPELGGNTQQLIADLYATIGVRFTPIPITPPQGPVAHTPPPRLSLQHDKVQAQRVADRAHGLGALPNGAQSIRAVAHPSRPPYTGSGTAVDRGGFWTVKGTVAQLTNYFQAHVEKGFALSEPGKVVHGVTRLVIAPRSHPKTVSTLQWVSMLQKGDTVVFRVDGQAASKAA
jgi:hypothetical protein